MSEVKDREAARAYAAKNHDDAGVPSMPALRSHLIGLMASCYTDGIAYGRANPLTQPDSKDMRETLKRFYYFTDQGNARAGSVNAMVDEFLSQEKK